MSLKGKRILITAGPTWVSIDPVRVISNSASGETGKRLAEACAGAGGRVTLLLGPGEKPASNKKVSVKRFTFFDELQRLFRSELRRQYDVVIHSAAVSDYRPLRASRTKISSRARSWSCTFVPTPKLISMIKRTSAGSYAVGFKYEPRTAAATLIRKARKLMDSCRLDAVVANTVMHGRYRAYIVTPERVWAACTSKGRLVRQLTKLVSL